jgi:hypothetical protein
MKQRQTQQGREIGIFPINLFALADIVLLPETGDSAMKRRGSACTNTSVWMALRRVLHGAVQLVRNGVNKRGTEFSLINWKGKINM